MLSTQSILIESEIKEGLFLVEVSSAFSILKRKGSQHIFEPVRAKNSKKLSKGCIFCHTFITVRCLLVLSFSSWRLFLLSVTFG